MLATPAITQGVPTNGPRPINLNKDTRQVLDLLNLTFGHRGHRRLGEQISLNYASPLTMRWNMISHGFIPGFVWEESGKIVGNVTLLETQISGRYIIANVAVLPSYQRRGIARALMNEALNYIDQRLGRKTLLQVERENEVAIDFYRSLGFSAIGTVNHWYVTSSRLKIIKPVGFAVDDIRQLDRHDWRAAFQLDRRVVQPDLNWPIPPNSNFFKTGIWRRFTDFINGQRLNGWVVRSKSPDDSGKRHLLGMTTLFSDWGRPLQIRLRVEPSWREQLEHPLLFPAITRIKKIRSGSALISHPAKDQKANELLVKSNFQLRRELTIMVMDMASYDDR